MLSSTSRSARSLKRAALVCGLALALALPAIAPLAPAVAAGDDDARALLARHAEAAGLSWADLENGAWTVVTHDGATGVTTTESVGLAAALDAVADAPAVEPSADPVPRSGYHLVAGGIKHSCSDGLRLCYIWEVLADQTAERHDAAATYEGLAAANGVSPAAEDFPLPSGQAVRIWGKYYGGVHRANDTAALFEGDVEGYEGLAVDNGDFGTGTAHADKALRGAGIAHIKLVYFQWGSNLYISFGRMSAQGEFAFCSQETTPECQSDAFDAVPALPAVPEA